MKKKIIAIFAIFILSFNIMASARQEKTEASALLLSYVIFKAGVSFTAFTGFASLMAVNGYHMQLSDMAVSFANKYYDYSNGVYTVKGDKINFIDKLNLATSSFISGNDPLTLSELNTIKNGVSESFPQIIDISTIEPDFEVRADSSSNDFDIYDYTVIDNGFRIIKPEFEGKIVKAKHGSSSMSDYYYYVRLSAVDYELNSTYSINFPILNYISPSGQVFNSSARTSYITSISTSLQKFSIYLQAFPNITNLIKDNYIGETPSEYNVTNNSYSSGTQDFIKAYPNYYSALSGKAATTDELLGLMNTDEYLQKEVAKLLENQKVNEQNTLEVPTVVDGVITYPTADIPDVPDVPYSPTETWYNDLLGWITNIPDLLIGGITDLFNDTLIPALDSLKNIVLQIPDLLTNIWTWILEFPELLYSWFVPTAPMIAETWQPVIDLWDFKLDPIIAPFKTLTFYETEYQDISVPLKFGSYEKEHKIIDFQYIKSQRDTIKSLIRSFLWILIIFFNLDQIHRLIRNQSLLNTYVRKIDKGA